MHLVAKSKDPSAYRFGGGVGKPLEQVLRTMAEGDVVVMDLQAANNASAWGGLVSRLAQRRGVRGTIMWGTCRDVEEIRQVGYPVWAVEACPRRSRNDFTFGSINEPITIAGVTIGRNDWIVADESGGCMRSWSGCRRGDRFGDKNLEPGAPAGTDGQKRCSDILG